MVVRSRASDNDRTERSGHDTISPGGVIFDAVVVVTGHGYEFTLDGTSIAMFDALLKTVTLSPSDAIHLPPMTGRFDSPTNGYSIATAADWTTTAATKRWIGSDNSAPAVDEVTFVDTDSSFSGASQALSKGTTYDQWAAAFHLNTLSAVPSGRDGGVPSAWPPILVGDQTGGLEMLCNAAEAIVHQGDRVYVFTWGSTTFNTAQHLSFASWKELLKTVEFTPQTAKP